MSEAAAGQDVAQENAPNLADDPGRASSPDGASHATDTLPLRTVLLYGLPASGLAIPNILLGLYFFKFATDVLLVAPGVLGVLIGLSRLWDAVSDPVAGYLSDRTQSAMGRRRPWMLVGGGCMAVALVVLWAPPANLHGNEIIVWIGVGLLLTTTASTIFGVPYGALGAELTTNHHDRTRLFAYRTVIGGIGMALALVSFYLLLEAEKPEQSWLGLDSRTLAIYVAIMGAAVALCSILTLVAFIRERPEYQTRGPDRIFGAFYDVFSNRHAQLLLFVFTVQTFGTASMGMLAAYLFQYILKAPNWMAAVFVGAFVVPMAISIPVWVRISRRFGKARTYTVTLFILGGLYSVLYFGLGEWDYEGSRVIIMACAYSGLLGVVSACGYVVAPSIKADIIDLDEYHTDQRKEGAYLAAWSFVQKSAAALAAMLLGAVLQYVGYTPGQEQTGQVEVAIISLISIVPGIAYFVAGILFRRFDLDEDEHTRIRAELDARAAARA